MWDAYIRDNINKLLNRGHRVLTVAQFSALTGLEDGDEVYLEVDAANGVMWHLRYVAAETTYKWRFLGGPSLVSRVDTQETITSSTYADAATVGPTITLPRGGDYEAEFGGAAGDTPDGGFTSVGFGLHVNGVLAADIHNFSGGGVAGGTWTAARMTGASSGHVAKVMYARATGATDTIARRRMHLRPVRLRHDG